jgi:hypothetical protein
MKLRTGEINSFISQPIIIIFVFVHNQITKIGVEPMMNEGKIEVGRTLKHKKRLMQKIKIV